MPTDQALPLVYLTGSVPDVDLATTRLIAEASGNVRITTVATAEEATTLLKTPRENAVFHGLLLSPTLAEETVLQLVAAFRRDRVPIAIVPVVTEAHRGLCASAVSAGADTVLLMLDGALVSPVETLECISRSAHRLPDRDPGVPAPVRAGRRAIDRLQALLLGARKDANGSTGDTNDAESPLDAGRVRLRALLNDAHVSRVRIESVLGLEPLQVDPPAHAEQPRLESPAPSQPPFVERRKKDRRKDAATKAQLDEALNEAFDARKELRDAFDAHSRDRASWETRRSELEAELGSLREELRATKERQAPAAGTTAELQTTLDHARGKLQDMNARLTSERAAWSAARQKLEGRLSELTAAAQEKEQLEAALKAARQQFQKTIDAQNQQQSAWKSARQGLEARIRELQTPSPATRQLEADLNASRREQQDAADRFASERARWETTRQALETERDARVHDLQAATIENDRLTGLVNDTRGEAERATAARRVCEAEREAHAHELHEATSATARLEVLVNTTRAELDRATDAHASASSAWEAAKHDLETQLDALQTARQDAEDALAAAREDLAGADATHAATLAAADGARQALEADVSQLRQETATYAATQSAWEAERRELEEHRKDAAVARIELEAAVTSIRDELRQTISTLASERDQWASERQAIDADREVRANELRGVQDVLAAARADLARAEAEHATALVANQSAWAAERHHLSGNIEAFRADARRAAETYSATQSAWEAERRELERKLEVLRADFGRATETAAAAEIELNAQLSRTRDELRQAVDTLASERTGWETARRMLEGDRDRRTAAHSSHASAWDAERRQFAENLEALRAEVRRGAESQAAERETWESARLTLEQNSRDSAATAERERQRLEDDLSEMRSRYAHLAATRQGLETELVDVTERARRLSEESAALRAELHALTASNDRAELEERLRQSLRREEVGNLAAAMAPELETVFKAVGEHGARLLQSLGAADCHRQDVEAIRAGSAQATGMLRQLLAFSRRQLQPLPAIDVTAVVERAEPMLARLCGTEVDLSMHLGPAAVVAITQDDFEQLITTLVFSARERLTVAGSLLVESSIIEPDQVTSNGKGPGAAPAGRRFRLTAIASGYGVQPPQPSSALERIVRRCGGELQLDGTPGRTSALHACLPIVVGPADSSKTH